MILKTVIQFQKIQTFYEKKKNRFKITFWVFFLSRSNSKYHLKIIPRKHIIVSFDKGNKLNVDQRLILSIKMTKKETSAILLSHLQFKIHQN